MGRSYDDFEAWLEAVDYHLDGPDHTDFDQEHEEAWANGLTPAEYAEILLDSDLPDSVASDDLYDESECWP